MKLNLVRMFARRMWATDRLVCSPPAFVSPRERRSATWVPVSPVAGVSTIGAAGTGDNEAARSAMPGHRVAVNGRKARPRPGRVPAASTAPSPRARRLTLPQTPSVHVTSAPILNGLLCAAAILIVSFEASANLAGAALQARSRARGDTAPSTAARAVCPAVLPKITSVVSRSSSPARPRTR